MLEKLFRLIVIVVLMLAIVAFWIWGPAMLGISLTVKFVLIGGGVSLFLLGLLYKFLGTWDLIPDWIPLLGSIDDKLAWVLMIIGILVAAGGFAFPK